MAQESSSVLTETQRLDELRQTLQELKTVHDALRLAVSTATDSTTLSLADVAKAGGTHPGRIEAFLKGETAILSGNILHGVAKICRKTDLAAAIERHAKGKSERIGSLVIFSEEMLDLYIALAKAFAPYAKRCTYDTFSKAFAPDHQTVASILRSQHEAIRKVQSDDDMRLAIMMRLEESLDTQVQAAIQAAHEAEKPLIEQLTSLMNQLQTHYGTKEAIYAALSIPKTTYRAVLDGLSSEPTIKAMIAKCEDGLKEITDGPRVAPETDPPVPPEHEPPAVTRDATPPVSDSARIEPEALQDFRDAVGPVAGITSDDGVEFTISDLACRRINIAMAGELIEPARHAITMVRAMLNLLAQTNDDDLRAAIQKKLNPDVVELMLTIEYFTARIPNEMLPLIQEKRRVLADLRQNRRK